MMKTPRLMVALGALLFMPTCATSSGLPATINLALNDSFRGEIFILEDRDDGQDWKGGSIAVNSEGVAFVKDLSGISELSPLRFRGTYPDGRRIGGNESPEANEVSLRHLSRIRGVALYFVVGTFVDQVELLNESMHWERFMGRIKSFQLHSNDPRS